MGKRMMKFLLTAALSAALLAVPALAAQEPPAQQPSPWAYGSIADSYAMGLMDDNYGTYITNPLTGEQLEAMTEVLAAKLALLELPQREGARESVVVDTTRSGVMNALYQECAAYALPGVEKGAEAFLSGLGVVQGDGADLAPGRTCTYQEAMVMTQRLILAVYDSQNAGSKGLLWKAVNGDNTLYLLGTIHMDRNNVYPLHKSLREALLSADTVAFELDFNDSEGLAEFAALQAYSDGTTLADHISPELYSRVSAALTGLGVTEEQFAYYKPWTLANSFSVLSMTDDTTSGNAMAIDLYCNSLASWAGIPVEGVETYALQANIFDTLDPEYLEAYLEGSLALFEAAQEGAEPDPEVAAAAERNEQMMDAMFTAWKNRDPEALSESYDKAAIMNSGDQLQSRLFTDRDPGMIKAAAAFLEREGRNTVFMAVGAGHMVDPGGIVSGLRELGYTVELMPQEDETDTVLPGGDLPAEVQELLQRLAEQWLVDGDYPKNSRGETYGPDTLELLLGYAPDLVAAGATNGAEGYIRRTDMDHVAELMLSGELTAGEPYTVPVYDLEGTVIGEFEFH